MRHIIFKEATQYSIAVLIKGTSFNKQELLNNYVNPMVQAGIADDSMIALTLKYDSNSKVPVKFMKEYLNALLPALDSLGVKYLYVADSNYFKVLTGQVKAEPHYGYLLPCKIKGYEHMQVVLSLNYQALIYNPDLQSKVDMSLHTLVTAVNGNYQAIGTDIIHSAHYPESLQDIAQALESLHQYDCLTCDIETRGLRFNTAGLETIAFAWNSHNGIAFAIDKGREVNDALYTKRLLKAFFSAYKGNLIYHNASFDVQILIYELWMKEL